MTRQQEKLVDMLIQFHNICEENGLIYYLIGNQLLFAAQNGAVHGYEADIAMYEEDWIGLQNIAENMDGIEFETVTDGGKLPGCYFRYIDKNTLLLDLDYYGVYSKPGIGLNIYIIRRGTLRARFLAVMERIMSHRAVYPERIGSKVYSFFERLIGEEYYRNWLAEMEKKARSKNRVKRSRLKEAYTGGCGFAPDFWKERTVIALGGHSFYTVRRYKEYLKKRFARNWRETEAENAKQTYRCLFSEELPYKNYMEAIQTEELLPPDFMKRCKRYIKRAERFKEMSKKEKEGWEKTMFAVGDRFRLWKKYMPQKDMIRELFQEQKYDEAELVLRDYINVLEKYMELGMVICFDPEFLEFVKKLYAINGHNEIVTYIDKNVLSEDLVPIEL